MNVLKLKMKKSMQLGGRVFPKNIIIYIDKYNPCGKIRLYTVYDENGLPLIKLNEGPVQGGDLLKNSEVIEE